MTDLDVLERIQGYVGGHIYKLTKQKQHHKQPWRWALSGLGAYELASKIAPFLLSRRSEQAHRMMDAYERSPKARWEKNRREIKRLREEGLTHEKIAQQLGLDRSQVSHVLRGRSKRSIPLVQTVGA